VSTIPTMATEPAASPSDDSATIPEKETEPSKDKLEDVPEPEATNESEEEEEEEKSDKQPTTKGASPYAVTLIEGVDIDAEFAKVIRTDQSATSNGWSGYGKEQNQLTDMDMEALTKLNLYNKNLASLKGIEYATNLKELNCHQNNLTTLDVSNNPFLTTLLCADNLLTSLDLTDNSMLVTLVCNYNNLTTLDMSNCLSLTSLEGTYNQLTSIDISHNTVLTSLNLRSNKLTSINVSHNSLLKQLNCMSNKLTNLELSTNVLLEDLNFMYNDLVNLDLTANTLLQTIQGSWNKLPKIDMPNNSSIRDIDVSFNKLTNLNFLSASNAPLLESFKCSANQITDITGAYGLTNLTYMDAGNQFIQADTPSVIGGNATIDLLKTSASTGLSLTPYSGSIILTANGDKIELSNVTSGLDGYAFEFFYGSNDLIEGSSSGYQQFGGRIDLAPASKLGNELTPSIKKVKSGDTVTWTWIIKNVDSLTPENIHAKLTLPSGLVIDPESIKHNGTPGTLSDIDGTTNLGNLFPGQPAIVLEFTTIASGNVNDWLKASGRLDWEDSNSYTRTNQTDGSVQIKDDEQTYTPKTQEDMALLSVPESFRFGFWDVKNTAQTFSLHSSNYLTNTKVVSEGFYTRLRDDRAVNSGWKLSAQLSDFKDSTSELMPNSAGTSLRMQDMSMESIVDRDTPAEAIDPTPTGVPSTVLTDETLVAGQTAKPLVTAGTGEGTETWQLRIPFDKVSLQLPANAGKKNTYYSATLTWSLDDTP
ncbi:MAG: WxL domain-containing protein, partial [Enterococcus hulanensis]